MQQFSVDANVLIDKLAARLARAVLESAQYEAALEAEQARNAELEARVRQVENQLDVAVISAPPGALSKAKAVREANGHS